MRGVTALRRPVRRTAHHRLDHPGIKIKKFSHLGGTALDDHEATLADGAGLHGVDQGRAGVGGLEGLDIVIGHLEKEIKRRRREEEDALCGAERETGLSRIADKKVS